MGKLLYVVLVFLAMLASAAVLQPQLLLQDEVEALTEIGRKLGKKDWDFSMDPCSGKGNWTATVAKGFENSITCDCTFDDSTTCRIVGMSLKGQNLTGVVPPEFARLGYLKSLYLSHNGLTGSIPLEWENISLAELSLMGSRLSGPFPLVITRITTLVNLSLEGNQLYGSIPSEIGLLVNLQRLVLSSNALTGNLPVELAKLTQLIDLRLSDNNFTGKIPDFISSWNLIEKLHMMGCSLEGPIPSSISALTNLIDLRITDLKGEGFPFPTISNMKSMIRLVLRNCLIQGKIPEFIGNMKTVKTLDLSFNNLTGEIPASFASLTKVDFVYLTGNGLTGQVPASILSNIKNIDLSYNNFTLDSSSPTECTHGSVNLVESYSSATTQFGEVQSCLKQGYPCQDSEEYYSLHINCGGKPVALDDKTTYESDLEVRGGTMFYSRENWAFSSTGNFMDDDVESDQYITANTSALHSNVTAPVSDLYTTARLSPLSLTYYGLCLVNGNYTVKLHFAEIVFTNDSTVTSVGRRIFDVYLQGNLVLKDFDIAADAGGGGKPIIKNFTALVKTKTLKIHLYWAGRGTQGIPNRGNYGPLISAISVDPNFKPPVHHNKKIVMMIGIIAAGSVCLLLVIILGILYKKGGKSSRSTLETGLLFTLKQMSDATNNFDQANHIGKGGFGHVYKGRLSDGSMVAVKQLSSNSEQGTQEFINEVRMRSALQHPNLVKIHGCCVEGNQLMLVYEYIENNSLHRALFGEPEEKLKLEWSSRKKIIVGIARGLAHLHEESSLSITHRDIKAGNILLDKDLNAKLSDFGIARLQDNGIDTITYTNVLGTPGYIAPEYVKFGNLSNKADIYSFGVVVLEIVRGQTIRSYKCSEEHVYLRDFAYVLQEGGSLMELVDQELAGKYTPEEVTMVLTVALMCTRTDPNFRPIMSQVLSMLEGHTTVEDVNSLLHYPSGYSELTPIGNRSEQSKSFLNRSLTFTSTDTASCSGSFFDVNGRVEESDAVQTDDQN